MEIMLRKAAVSGTFYPGEKQRLSVAVDKYIKDSKEMKVKGKLQALIVPHAGYAYSGIVAGAGYKLLQQKLKEGQKFRKVILLGPSHFVGFHGASLSKEDFITPLGIVKSGKEKLTAEEISDLPEAHLKEHSLEVQLPFLQKVLGDFELYPMVLGEQDNASILKLAKVIEEFKDDNTLILISSDLSHYLAYDTAVKRDTQTLSNIRDGNMNDLEACGYEPIRVLMQLAKNLGWISILLDYRNSGDTSGNKTQVVGYAAIAYVQ